MLLLQNLLIFFIVTQREGYAADNIHKYNVKDVEQQLCFLTAVSSNHLHGVNGFLKTVQKFHPCAKTYIYDLGLKKWERSQLQALPFVEEVMNLTLPVRGTDYFPSGSCAFKPPMIAQFIDKYRNNETNCRFFFYGDSVIFFHHKFNRKAYDEVIRHGQYHLPSISITHSLYLQYTLRYNVMIIYVSIQVLWLKLHEKSIKYP
jgi:hypothetical protein